jgi:hypothetical protein
MNFIDTLYISACAACRHPRDQHKQNRCFGLQGTPTGPVECWCRGFVTDFPKAVESIIENGDLESVQLAIHRAIERGDTLNAHRLLDQWLIKTPFATRDHRWASEMRGRISSVSHPFRNIQNMPVEPKAKTPELTGTDKIKKPERYPTMTLQEVLSVIPVSRSTIYRYVDEGKLLRPRLNKKAGKRAKFLILTKSVAKLLEETEL